MLSEEGKALKETVQWFLENEIETRNDDDLLVALVCRRYNPTVAQLDYFSVEKNRCMLGIPTVESITRYRRMVQTEKPELMGCDAIMRRRLKKEKEWREAMRKNQNV